MTRNEMLWANCSSGIVMKMLWACCRNHSLEGCSHFCVIIYSGFYRKTHQGSKACVSPELPLYAASHSNFPVFCQYWEGCLCAMRGTFLQLDSSFIYVSQSQPLQCDQVVSFTLICMNPRNKNPGPGG